MKKGESTNKRRKEEEGKEETENKDKAGKDWNEEEVGERMTEIRGGGLER